MPRMRTELENYLPERNKMTEGAALPCVLVEAMQYCGCVHNVWDIQVHFPPYFKRVTQTAN